MNDLKRDIPAYPDQSISFTVEITPSSNHMHIGRTKHLTKLAKEYITKTQQICTKTIHDTGWLKDHDYVWYHMDMVFYFPDRRYRDNHNCLKLLLDTLEGLLFSNDYFVMPRVQHVGYDKDNPRIEITITPER